MRSPLLINMINESELDESAGSLGPEYFNFLDLLVRCFVLRIENAPVQGKKC